MRLTSIAFSISLSLLLVGACSDGGDTSADASNLSAEICDNGLDDDGNGQFDCLDSACQGTPNCSFENCTNGVDDDGDMLVDCDDTECASGSLCTGIVDEICNNSLDDDGDMAVDCDDSDCVNDPVCDPGMMNGPEICNNMLDDDGDMAIDCNDSDCSMMPVCTDPPMECVDNCDDPMCMFDVACLLDCSDCSANILCPLIDPACM